jgi:hypothetical protein
MNDALIDLVAQLPGATVGPARARRTQARCHRVLERRAHRNVVAQPRAWQGWSRALVGLGMAYLAEAVRQALRVYGTR